MPTRKRMTPEMRMNLIEGVVYRSPEPMTVLDIARSMGMKRSPYLCNLIDRLVGAGRLVQTEVVIGPDLVARAYIAPIPSAH